MEWTCLSNCSDCSCSPQNQDAYIAAVTFCVLFLVVAIMEAVLLLVLYLSYRKIKLRISGDQDTNKLALRLPHWINFSGFTLNGWLHRRDRETNRSPTTNTYKITDDLIAARKPNMPSHADDERTYSKLVHNASNNEGEQETQLSFATVSGYEEPLHTSSGDATHTPGAVPYACSTLPKVRPETAAVPIAKPREHRSFSTGKRQLEVPQISVSLQEEHTYTSINKKKPPQQRFSSTGKTTCPQPPSSAVKPTQLLQPHVMKKGKSSRRKSNPPPVVNKPVPIFATYSTAQDPNSEDTPQRALSGSRPPIKPKPKGCIISSYSLAISESPANGGECEYDVAISSVVPPKEDIPQEYDYPLPPSS